MPLFLLQLKIFSGLCLISDFAASHAPVRHPPGWSDSHIPSSFPEFNSGVMLLKRSNSTLKLIGTWLDLYDELFLKYKQVWDQASLRSAVWDCILKYKLGLAVLPPEYNLRTTKPWIAGRGLPVSVIHGRFPDSEVEAFVSYLNNDHDRFRTWVEWLTLFPHSFIKPRFDRTYS